MTELARPDSELAGLVGSGGSGGSWTTAYVDGTAALPQVEEEARRRSVRERLIAAGAPEDDAVAIDKALETPDGLPSPSSRFLLASGGDVVLNTSFATARWGPEVLLHGPLPSVLPLLRHEAAAVRYLVVEASREGADISLETAGRGATEMKTVEGRTDDITKVQAGGLSHSAYQRYAESTWKHNQSEVASAVSALIRDEHPGFVVLAGDVRARQLLREELTHDEQDLLVDVDAHTRADGADTTALDAAISDAVEEHLRMRLVEVRDRAAADSGAYGAEGVSEVVAALQQARGDVLLLDNRMLDSEQTLLALDASPWVASDESETLGASVIAEAPVGEALARAAILTDARVLVEEDAPLAPDEQREDRPVREPIAALRWPDQDMPA